MELPLFNSILFRELRPGQVDATDRKKFMQMVNTANAVSPAAYGELLSQLSTLLSDFPELQKAIHPPTALKVKLQPLLYSLPHPQHTDPFTQFYSLLIQKETLRVSNLLIQQIAELPDALVKPYDVKQALKSVRVLAAKTAKHLRESGFTAFPDGSSPLEHFVFFTLKQMLSALFFDIQERFKDLLAQRETPQSFSNTYLQEPHNRLELQPTPDFFEFHINRLIPENKFSEPEALELLKQINQQQDAKFANLQAALENLIFLRSKNHDNAALTLDLLASQDFVKQHLSTAKETITQEINQYNTGHERLDVVDSALEPLDYIQPTPVNKLSIPQKLFLWLQEKKALYTATASQIYTVEPDPEAALRKNGKPVAKRSHTTVQTEKQTAHEYLKFMSGYNRMNERIMPEPDFKKLISSVSTLIETGNVPKNLKPIPQIGLKTNFIRFTFYKLHQTLFTTNKIKPEWIDFLHAFFAQFKNTAKSTTKAKFAEKPKSYETDLAAIQQKVI